MDGAQGAKNALSGAIMASNFFMGSDNRGGNAGQAGIQRNLNPA